MRFHTRSEESKSWIAPRHLITSVILFLLAQILFLINIQFPKTPNFDEFHYIPSAKQFLELKVNQNWEHPPLGKLIIAAGMAIWGDQPIGWRFMSTVFGSITLVGMYFLAFALFESAEAALWVALLTLVNQLLYVQSRIGMLDTFMMGFLVWAMALFCASFHPSSNPGGNLAEASHSAGSPRHLTRETRSQGKADRAKVKNLRLLFLGTGILLGLATACKWFAVIPWAAMVGLFVGVRLFQKWELVFLQPKDSDWYQLQLWRGIRWIDVGVTLGLVPLFAYFLTFIPLFLVPNTHYSFWDLFDMQYKMWDGQLRVVSNHPYMSRWMDWPLMTRPIWYAFDRDGPNSNFVRGVLLLGNPLIMWTGLIALLGCLWGWVQLRHRQAFLILFFFAIFYFSWALIPRKIEFYYYYYPAGMVLSLAIAYCFFNPDLKKLFRSEQALTWVKWSYLGIAVAFFVYFFPILAALQIPIDSFRNWMWFNSWI